MPTPSQQDMRCPTCGARQAWTDACRRCKCDLRLLCAAASSYEQHRQSCLEHLIGGTPERAVSHAHSCHGLAPGGESLRLIALCQLHLENWADAWEAAESALATEKPPQR